MSRLELTRRIVSAAGNELLVSGIGNATFDLIAAQDRVENFYMMGSMGLAIPIALGLAIAQPQRSVVVMEGEGSILMNLGALATVGREAPPNLTIVIWDNAQWQLTGGQPVATESSCDIAAVARACGIAHVDSPADPNAFERLVQRAIDSPGPHAIVARIDATGGRSAHMDPVYLKHRFMRALGLTPD
ncbi:MAG TPA: thiamine pyrophosphate-dependent enzyme [Thermomicrobiales bacterium]|nr:thiamine pyrophosphate-dependent enzyme [Thermomicrobiales bacterium]